MKTFASDNYSGVHPEVMAALQRANEGHAGSYGNDPFTASATKKFKEHFGNDAEVFFVYNGTAANVLGLSALTHSFHSVICAEGAHINVDESTAPEKFLGCKLVHVPSPNGKITPEQINQKLSRQGDQHHPQVKVVSISQATEYGTVYDPGEIKMISKAAKDAQLYFHMDGSRLSNAAVTLKKSFRELTRDAGVDILSFGGTKNGMMFGEAIVIFDPALAADFQYRRKQGMQLHSKMRFISVQFEALLTNSLWERNATHTNSLAKKLAAKLRALPGISITQEVNANGVFAIFPRPIIAPLQNDYPFYVWNESIHEVRLMCSWDTTEDEVEQFVNRVRELVGKSDQ
jgi:threonine aldolase